MKLRNKKTGEVIILIDHTFDNYNSLAEFNEEWEDYKPAEPLIKDEKVRKTVRAWAEVNLIKKVKYYERSEKGSWVSSCVLVDMGEEDYSIEFVGWIPTLKDDAVYIIDELCGEKEEE